MVTWYIYIFMKCGEEIVSNKTESELITGIQSYYENAEKAYRNWGKDEERKGIYSLHCGYEEPGEHISHLQSIKRLTQVIVTFMDIQANDAILDAGCGTGAATFEIKSTYPSTTVYGINLSLAQLQTAQAFAHEARIANTFFALQDYLQTAFKSGFFNKIVFIESIAHAQTKQLALHEAFRLLLQGGSLTIADVFLRRDPQNEQENEWIRDLQRGWFMPDLVSLEKFKRLLQLEGFILTKERDISENILPSTLRMRKNSEQRLIEFKQEEVPDEIYWSRKAVVASHKVVDSGLMGYHLLNMKKVR